MKKITSLFLLLCMSMATWATKTLYLAPNSNWMTGGAKVAVYYYNDATSQNGWSEFMTSVAGQTNLYTTTIPDEFPTIIFCRMDGSKSERKWDNKWNQSADLLLPAGKDLFVLADGWDNMSGMWFTYSAGMSVPAANPMSVPNDAPDVMLQAFYYNSYPGGDGVQNAYGNTGWSTLISKAEEIGTYFDLVWLPPCSSGGGTGYIPQQYSNLNSSWGSESDLKTLISKLHAKDTKVIADIVVNHVSGSSGWCTFAPLNFGDYGAFNPTAAWICKTDEMNSDPSAGDCQGTATGNSDDGYGDEANYTSARDWDHTNPQVQAMCRAYLQWMKNNVGFDGWRYDYGKGFNHKHINDYNSAAGAYLTVIEYWDGNPDVINGKLGDASGNTMYFDFGTKYDAINSGICSWDYTKCNEPGMLNKEKNLRKNAVTFVDNHDTFARNNSEFGGQNNSMKSDFKDRLLQANAYILSMPGIPCVFYPHWVAYGDSIKKMIEARHLTGVHSCSEVKDVSCDGSGYQATIVGKNGYIVLQLGNKAGNTINGFTKHAFGNGYAMWIYTNTVTPVDPNAPKFYVTGNAELIADANLGGTAWAPNAIESKEEVIELSLKAGVDYKLKVTVDGTWKTVKGFGDLTTTTDGLSGDGDGNICFSLTEAGKVKVTYNASAFKLEGAFKTSGGDNPGDDELPTVQMKGSWDEWAANVDFTAATDGKTASVKKTLAKGTIEFKMIVGGDWKSNEATITRSANSTTGITENKDGNIKLNADVAGEYTFTWTYATSALAVTFPEAGDDPGDDPGDPNAPKFYVTGNAELIADANLGGTAWAPNAIESKEEVIELSLKAGVDYKLKVTVDGTWKTVKGFGDLTTTTDGLSGDGDGNICFQLSTAGKVKVTYNASQFTLEGAIKTDGGDEPGDEPGETEYYLKNNWGGGEAEWSWKKMTADEGGTFKLEKVVFGGTGVNYNTAETDEGSAWVALDAFKGDKVAAKDTVTFTLDPTAGTITAKLIGKYVQAGGDDPEQPTTDYYLKNNWGGGEAEWTWKKMTAVGDGTYKLEIVVFGGSGVNYNTAETDEESTWVALDAFKGDKVAAKDTVTFTLDPTVGTITSKLVGKFATSGDQPGGGDDPEQPAATKYYLVGSATDWKVVKEAQYTFAATDVEGEFKLATTLTLGQAIKVVGVQDETQTWYPDGEGNEYVVDADHAGNVTIYFRPAGGNDDWAEFGGYIYIAKNTATDLDVIRSDEPAQKLLMNGQLFILRGTRIYTVTGQLVR